MSKPTPEATPLATKTVEAVASVPLTLDEYCGRKSETDRRVELIGAFHSAETRAGHTKDTAEKFAVRFEAFINKPA